MMKYISILGLFLLFMTSCKNEEPYSIKLTNSFANYSELLQEYNDIEIDSVNLFGEPKVGFVLEVEITNNSVDRLCLYTQSWSDHFIDISKIQTKHPTIDNPLNWSIGILDNWGKFGESCISTNESEVYLVSFDYLDMTKDSLIITFASPKVEKGIDWVLPSLTN